MEKAARTHDPCSAQTKASQSGANPGVAPFLGGIVSSMAKAVGALESVREIDVLGANGRLSEELRLIGGDDEEHPSVRVCRSSDSRAGGNSISPQLNPFELVDCRGNGCQGNDMQFYSPDDFEPGCSIGYLVRRTYQIGLAALEPMFAEEGLSGIQWSALMSLWFERGSTCAELARDLHHDKGAMTRLVDTLEQRGWLTRVRDTDDRRIINLTLTDEGRAIASRCRIRVVDYWNMVLKDWDRSEVATLVALMQKLRMTMESATADGIRA